MSDPCAFLAAFNMDLPPLLQHYTPYLAVAVCMLTALHLLQPRKCDPREPPLIPSAIPYIGHLLGMLRQGGRYFGQLAGGAARGAQPPIFALATLASRTY